MSHGSGIHSSHSSEQRGAVCAGGRCLIDRYLRLHAERATGVLQVRTPWDSPSIYYRRGAPIYVTSLRTESRLGQLLCEAGDITLQQAHAAASSRVGGQRIGERLVQMGVLTRAQVHRALGLQVRQRFRNTLRFPDGRWIWRAGDRWRGSIPEYRTDAVAALVSGIEQWADSGHMAAQVHTRADLRVAVSSAFAIWAPQLSHGERLIHGVASLRTGDTVMDLADALDFAGDGGIEAVFQLLALGLVTVDGPDSAQARPVPQHAVLHARNGSSVGATHQTVPVGRRGEAKLEGIEALLGACQWSEAAQLAERRLRSSPADSYLMAAAAWAESHLTDDRPRREELAAARLEWVTHHHPEIGEAWLYLGRVESRRSNRAYAADCLRRAAILLHDPALETEADLLER